MPRPKSVPRLWLDKERQSWSLIDGSRTIRTGCGAGELQPAKDFLADYLNAHHTVVKGKDPFIADCLKVYKEEHLEFQVSWHSVRRDLTNLTLWWGDKRASEIDAANCRLYIAHRNAPTICRRELGFLAAGVAHYHKSKFGPLNSVPIIVKPDRRPARLRWLTRAEAAQFLWAMRKLSPLRRKRLRRFFIMGWYTGTRHNAICRISWKMMDFESRIVERRPPGVAETKKRRPPFRAGARLVSHLKRWHRLDGGTTKYPIEHGGKPVHDLNDAWAANRTLAGFEDDVIPHTLRHSRATHMMKQRVDPWEAAQSLGMSVAMLEKTYGHHHPDWQAGASEAR